MLFSLRFFLSFLLKSQVSAQGTSDYTTRQHHSPPLLSPQPPLPAPFLQSLGYAFETISLFLFLGYFENEKHVYTPNAVSHV